MPICYNGILFTILWFFKTLGDTKAGDIGMISTGKGVPVAWHTFYTYVWEKIKENFKIITQFNFWSNQKKKSKMENCDRMCSFHISYFIQLWLILQLTGEVCLY